MNDAHTDSLDQGFAPTAPEQPLGSVLDSIASDSIGGNPQGMVMPADQNRLKTQGEKRFDWGTYGGVAMLGNEAASLLITTQTERTQWHAKQMAYFKSLQGKKYVPEYVHSGGLMNVLIALIGGMTMVPFVKYLEDHKSEIVRKSDRKHYGTQADTDPAIVAAHKEMDEAPKQSWGSLWKGRILTVVGAIVVDWVAGSTNAPSTKLFPNSPTFQKYASMDRMAAQASNGVMNALKISNESRPTWNKWLQKGTWLLVLSSTLTVMFYVSSKIFATRRDEKIERREARSHNGTAQRDESDSMLPAESTAMPETQNAEPDATKRDQPRAQISSIAHEATLAGAPQLAQGA